MRLGRSTHTSHMGWQRKLFVVWSHSRGRSRSDRGEAAGQGHCEELGAALVRETCSVRAHEVLPSRLTAADQGGIVGDVVIGHHLGRRHESDEVIVGTPRGNINDDQNTNSSENKNVNNMTHRTVWLRETRQQTATRPERSAKVPRAAASRSTSRSCEAVRNALDEMHSCNAVAEKVGEACG